MQHSPSEQSRVDVERLWAEFEALASASGDPCSPGGDLYRRMRRIMAPSGRLEHWVTDGRLLERIMTSPDPRGRAWTDLIILVVETALDAGTRSGDHVRLGEMHHLLGAAFHCKCATAVNPEECNAEAQRHYQVAIDAFVGTKVEWKCAMIHHGLGLLANARGYLDMAIDQFQRALATTTDETPQEDEEWAQTARVRIRSDLALALFEREDSGEMEEAIRHLETAAIGVKNLNAPALEAVVEERIAILYRWRKLGERLDNLRISAQHYDAALHIFTALSDEHGRARARAALGSVLLRRTDLGDGDWASEAITHFRAAQCFYTETSDRRKWACLERSIGEALTSGKFEADLECSSTASSHFQNAIRVFQDMGDGASASLTTDLLQANEKLRLLRLNFEQRRSSGSNVGQALA